VKEKIGGPAREVSKYHHFGHGKDRNKDEKKEGNGSSVKSGSHKIKERWINERSLGTGLRTKAWTQSQPLHKPKYTKGGIWATGKVRDAVGVGAGCLLKDFLRGRCPEKAEKKRKTGSLGQKGI